MIRVAFRKIKRGKEERLRAWLAELMERQDEVRETFIQETVRHEQAFIIDGPDGSILVYVIEAENIELGRRAFGASLLPIDIEHKKVMRETLSERLDVEPLYNCTLHPEDMEKSE
jgi:hypothetical protein